MVWYFEFICLDFAATLLMCHVPLPVLACFPAKNVSKLGRFFNLDSYLDDRSIALFYVWVN